MKKVISLLMALVMVAVMLTGCGAGAEGSASNGEATYKIGSTGPLTGDAALYGIAVKNGMQIAIDEINEAGGVNGAKLELNFQDDECDAEKAVNGYNTLKDWGMQIFAGTVTSGACIAVAAETNQDNIFQITPSGSDPECIKNPNAFQVCFADPSQGKKSAEYIGNKGLASKVAVIYDSSSSYSSGIYASFAAEAPNRGFEIVAAEAFTSDSKSDFSVQLQKAMDEGAELVFLPIYYAEASLILTQANQMGYAPIFFGVDGMDGILGVKNFDTSLAEDVMLLTPFAADSTDEATAHFVKAYQDKYNEVPMQFAADGYDAVYAVKEALEKSGCDATMSASDICDKLVKAITEIKIQGVTGELSWDASGESNRDPKAVIIKNGAYVLFE
ncbi:MAG: ABC transporter substrate-binding protein [Lachnospiraceae bacterium]|nr:ABC transporter substrate-binding protein [Lachnospiraceae bacterium]